MNMKQVLGTALVAVTMMASTSAMARGSVPAGAPLVSPSLTNIGAVLLPPVAPGATVRTFGATVRFNTLIAAIKANPTAGFSLR